MRVKYVYTSAIEIVEDYLQLEQKLERLNNELEALDKEYQAMNWATITVYDREIGQLAVRGFNELGVINYVDARERLEKAIAGVKWRMKVFSHMLDEQAIEQEELADMVANEVCGYEIEVLADEIEAIEKRAAEIV